MINAIRAVAAGQAYLDPSLTRKVMGGYVNRFESLRENKGELTDRENEVIKLIAFGYSNKEIADAARSQRKNDRGAQSEHDAKARISSRIDIVKYAILQGWLQDDIDPISLNSQLGTIPSPISEIPDFPKKHPNAY